MRPCASSGAVGQVRRHAIASASSPGAPHPEPPDSDHGTDSSDSRPSGLLSGSDGHSTPSLSPSGASSDSDGPPPLLAGEAQRASPLPAGAHSSHPSPVIPHGGPKSPPRTPDAGPAGPHTSPSADPRGPGTPLPSSSDSDSGPDALAPMPSRPRSRPRRGPPARSTSATTEPDTMLVHPMPYLPPPPLRDRQHDAAQAPLPGRQTRSAPQQAPLPNPRASNVYGWLD